MRRPAPLIAIFFTVFLDMLSFGLVIPDIQLRGNRLGAEGLTLGLMLASFSIAQFITAPFLGRWSDRAGRRPVLIVTTLCAIVAHLFYAHADALWIVFAARIFSGIGGANIGVAYAYIADVTTPQERGKGMGMVGAAFGLGFILGPGLGAYLVGLGGGEPHVLGYVAAALATLNLLFILALLPEPQRHAASERVGFVKGVRRAFSSPGLGILLLMFFAYNFGFTNLETTFFQLLKTPRGIFNLGEAEARQVGAIILVCVGVVGAIMQGGLVRRLIPRFGEVNLVRAAYLIQAPTLAAFPFAPLWIPMLFATVLLGIGGGLAQPSLGSLISRNAPRDLQGGIFGVTQGLGALARIIGPLVSNSLFVQKPYLPYLLGAAMIAIPAVGAWWLRMPDDLEEEGGPATAH